jgi:hypothetical protein
MEDAFVEWVELGDGRRPLVGPYVARRSEPEGDGCEIVDTNGIVSILCLRRTTVA